MPLREGSADADKLHPWPADKAALVYARFVLSHLADPERLLERAWGRLLPGGAIVTEDIDYGSQFCDPPGPASTATPALCRSSPSARRRSFHRAQPWCLGRPNPRADLSGGTPTTFGNTWSKAHLAICKLV
ncbi:MAG: class I SAM-dependent methyltransferase [Mesorhizobium sp.]|uniref:class I SAM-dependent methyltransferase n=1 Tax=Mesorhizobium sp. TaxID=1871066 RepID=UPI0011F4CA41|nr:MAG: class I SAM-dependent methyltransferase [Mesorhizobium sp.]TJU84690.1 MAG: class I SAM-dependent methyltransferase [Mesorhizobium sp.]